MKAKARLVAIFSRSGIAGTDAARATIPRVPGDGAPARRRTTLALLVAGAFLMASLAPAASANTVTVQGAGSGSGVVTGMLSDSSESLNCTITAGVAGGDCVVEPGIYPTLYVVSIVATPSSGSIFTGWTSTGEAALSTCKGVPASSCVVGFTGSPTGKSHTLTATFEPAVPLTLTTDAGTGTGTVQCDTGSGPKTCAAEFAEGTEVEVIPTADAGSEFVEWTGDCTGTSACEVMMDEARAVNAVFDLEPTGPALTIDIAAGTGTGTVECEIEGGPAEPCEANYDEGTELTLVPTADTGSEFTGFENGTGDAEGCTGTGPCSFTLNQDSEVEAPFDLIDRALTIEQPGTGTGTVECEVEGGSAEPCAPSYPHGTEVVAVASPEVGSEFLGWSGDCDATSGTEEERCEVLLDADKTVESTFDLIERALTIEQPGSGTGTVECEVEGGSAEPCAPSYPHGTEVVAVASPEVGSEFLGWSGDCDAFSGGEEERCEVLIDADKTIAATFSLPGVFPLTIATDGSGTGDVLCEVEGGPAEPCEASYPTGTEVALLAQPDTSSTFAGFSGDCTGTTCELTMDEAHSVTATFELIERTLTLSVSGEGEVQCKVGAGAFDPCAATYPNGAELTLSALPGAHSAFDGWSGGTGSAGACAGTADCAFTIEADSSLDAPFSPIPRALTLQKDGGGDGGFECDSGSGFGPCQTSYDDGTDVTVRALPDASSVFAGWSGGGCSGTGDCTIAEIDADTTLTATFELAPRALELQKDGEGDGTFQCDAGTGPEACQPAYPDGTTITVFATPEANSLFAGWTSCASEPAPGECTVTEIAADTTLAATFELAPRALTIDKAGDGDGSFECDTGSGFGPCEAAYPHGRNIIVKAIPGPDSAFEGWDGCGSEPSPGNCAVHAIAADTTVTAGFSDTTPEPPADEEEDQGQEGSPPPPAPMNAPPPTSAPGVAIAPALARLKGNGALIRLACGRAAGACKGALRLYARLPQPHKGRKGKRRRRAAKLVLIGRARFALAPGTARAIRVPISNRRAKRLLQGGRALRAQVRGKGIRNRALRLRAPQAKKKKSDKRPNRRQRHA